MNEVSASLIRLMVLLVADWSREDKLKLQGIFCQYQDSKSARTPPQPVLDWCAKATEGGAGTCRFQKLLLQGSIRDCGHHTALPRMSG